jgi:hypothetical protein
MANGPSQLVILQGGGDRVREFQVLIDATGGTVSSTTEWCDAYLRIGSTNPALGLGGDGRRVEPAKQGAA